jgi:hypoxanthine phosphoribosyltransferase
MRLNPELVPLLEVDADAQIETPDSMRPKIQQLGRLAVDRCAEEGLSAKDKYQVIVALPRGSYEIASVLSRALGYTSSDIQHLCLSSYTDGVTREKKIKRGQLPSEEAIYGKRIITIEDVCDSGLTLAETNKILMNEKGAASNDIAVVHYKPTKSENGLVPDYYIEETDKWIVYPSEVYERLAQNGVNVLELDDSQIWVPDTIADEDIPRIARIPLWTPGTNGYHSAAA